ncbi:adenine/guanine phosphoribosyltransferase-like PRPP-binding protein [Pseudorhizobium tarimense]|uniref:Adenine/guanine phosphoribosyltransferase-like PRPP-binding protein n=1 Tax=Pseudorhizobium tarimense TaxID=1079109 RepID=A0ABV2HBF6_9HYPH|nr:phosphoribosyltransferase [Pseudorhizobium tarimense]MCJ8520710.1 phosphoribosyltransferase [Pseudorhizobium tarimense]
MQPHDFWQEIYPPGSFPRGSVYTGFYPAVLPDGTQIKLPIRPLDDGIHALASLIINQASFAVQDALAKALADKLRRLDPQIIVGLPTLGLTLASAVARELGHARFVPLGTSRKFWYDESLSVPLSSITTPDQIKRLYVDPRMLPLLEGRRIVLIDDVVSSGASMRAGLRLLSSCGVSPVALGVAMVQTERWRNLLREEFAEAEQMLCSVFSTPRLARGGLEEPGSYRDAQAQL